MQAAKSPQRSVTAIIPVLAILLLMATVLGVCGVAVFSLLGQTSVKPTTRTIPLGQLMPAIETLPAQESPIGLQIGVPALPTKPFSANTTFVKPKSANVVAKAEGAFQAQAAYLIMPGDTLSAIAIEFNVPFEEIAKINALQNINLIYTGITLLIPEKPANQIVVQRGDSLWGLSLKYKTTLDELVKLNNMPNMNTLYAGQGLVVPNL